MSQPTEKKAKTPTLKLSTGASMPQLGYGTFLSKPGEVGPAVKVALETGYKHIDCASVYGNEKEIGVALKAVFEDKDNGIKREDVFITSKIWIADARPDTVKSCLEATLKDLQLDYLDLYLIHTPIMVEPDPTWDQKHRVNGRFRAMRAQGWGLQDIWRGMEACHAAGLTKAIGVSNYNVQALNDLLCYAKVQPAVNQVERHPYLVQPGLKALCDKNNVVITCYSPLGAPGLYGKSEETPVLKHAVVAELAKKHSKTPAQILIRWGIDSGTTTIPKSVKAHRIKENFDVLDFKLTADDMIALQKLDKARRLFKQDHMGVPCFE